MANKFDFEDIVKERLNSDFNYENNVKFLSQQALMILYSSSFPFINAFIYRYNENHFYYLIFAKTPGFQYLYVSKDYYESYNEALNSCKQSFYYLPLFFFNKKYKFKVEFVSKK